MDATTLAAFLAVDLLLVFTPGADWAFAISAGLRERSVLPAVAGLIAAYAGCTLLAVAGLVVIVAGSPAVLTALTVTGAGYLVWLGSGVLRQPATVAASEEAIGSSRMQVMGLFGTLHMTASALVHLAVGLLARTVLKTRPSAARVVTRISGAAMIVIGALLLVGRLAA
ncbi:LysE family transporter [Streptomyces sp. NPDC050625]|uniref:LysE family translocator n=1 Tax=Streptomyces sp. NPDC050625 TaxID=3154629 RepID=UPI00342B776C